MEWFYESISCEFFRTYLHEVNGSLFIFNTMRMDKPSRRYTLNDWLKLLGIEPIAVGDGLYWGSFKDVGHIWIDREVFQEERTGELICSLVYSTLPEHI